MSFIQNLFTSRDNNANGASYVGQQDRIWWNPDTNSFYYSDGNTAGGIPIGTGAVGNGLPGGPTNSVQYNAGNTNFGGSSNFTYDGTTLTVTGNTVSTNFLSDNYLYANGESIFGNTSFSGNSTFANISVTNTANLGNFTIYDQTLAGTIDNRDVNIRVIGNTANVNIDGPLNVHGAGNLESPPQFEVKSDGQSVFRVPTLDANLGAVQIIGTTSGQVVPAGNPGGMLQITGQNNQVSRVYNDAVNNYPLYVGRRYNGTALAPTGVLQNQVISRLGANPYLTDTAGFTPLGVAQINFVATENQTTTAQGSKITMNTTPTGSNVQSQVAEFNYGGIILTGNLLPTTDDVYSLGNASLRWVAAHFGNAGIYIQDNTLGGDGQLLLDNGILNFDNIDSLRVGNLQFTSTGIITTINPALDVLIGNPGDTGNTVIRNAGIKFTDNTIQTTAAIPLTQKGNALGVVPLNAATKIDPIYLPAGGINFLGIWDAGNNTPTLADGIGNVGDEYIVGIGGTQDLGSGNITFAVGDFVLYTSGNVWADVPVGGTGVSAFNSRTGNVTLLSGDVTNALSTGAIVNSKLQNSSVTVSTGVGLSGGQVVPLGGTITLVNTGVTAAVAGTGVSVSAATGNVTFSIGQNVATNATVQFNAISSTTTIQAIGNITGGNLTTGGRVVATGNIVTLANVVTPGTVINSSVSTTGNVIGANLVGQNLTAGRVAIVGSGKEVSDDPDFTYNSTTNVLSVAGNVNASYFNGNVIGTGNISTTGNVTGNYVIASGGNTVINAGVSTTGNVTGNYIFGNGSQLTGVITTILPTALTSTVHIAANTVGNTATIITDATTATVANTIVVRDEFGGINVNNWSINARTTATSTTATATDYWIGCLAKNLTVTLPNAANGAVQGRQYLIVDCVQSGAPGDTIATQAGATVVGGSLSQQGQSKTCVFIAATNTWYCN
jgi:hypothetical protein